MQHFQSNIPQNVAFKVLQIIEGGSYQTSVRSNTFSQTFLKMAPCNDIDNSVRPCVMI